MQIAPIKFGLIIVIFFEIVILFFMLKVYNDFVSSPDNYYKNILIRQAKNQQSAAEVGE